MENLNNLTPAMKQYVEVKQRYPDCLVMFRMGDFYEMFYEDAITASRELEITLTSRGKDEKKAPLAGVPYHAVEQYLARLVRKGYKIVIVEQVEDPKLAKGLVKRDVVRIITPGTVMESSMLDSRANNYIASLNVNDSRYSLALCDISTGEFLSFTARERKMLNSDLAKYMPTECIIPLSLTVDSELLSGLQKLGIFVTKYEDRNFSSDSSVRKIQQHFNVISITGLGLENENLQVSSVGALLNYIQETQFSQMQHIAGLKVIRDSTSMVLEASTIRNLEIIRNVRDNSAAGTLLSVLDKTFTPMGSRLLRKWLLEPLMNLSEINKRLNAVDVIKKNSIARESIQLILKRISDIERLISKVDYGNAMPKDLLALKHSLNQISLLRTEMLPVISRILENQEPNLLRYIYTFDDFSVAIDLIESSIREDALSTVREGDIIKPEFDSELKKLHSIKQNSRGFIAALEEKERSSTGIKGLKIGFNNVFGYYIEITKANLHLAPQHYIRKQTTANSERFVTEELKEHESVILGADEKIRQLEFDIFVNILKKLSAFTQKIQQASSQIAALDVIVSFANVALTNNYCRPIMENSGKLEMIESRHPVIEQLEKSFVSNDVKTEDNEMLVITGPNMAGKSTFMRQVALNVLMAQAGSFVAATEAKIGIVDRIFTRVGAHDDLSSGQSTFMVEMIETANILNNSTANSLIILDEIGRGTSTFDGVAIAWSVAEHIYNRIKAKTLFATHYHVMNKLALQFENVRNCNIAVMETGEEIVFLRKIVPGGTDKSYGIHVAKLAGVPKEVIDRAKEIQTTLETEDSMIKKVTSKKLSKQRKLGEIGK